MNATKVTVLAALILVAGLALAARLLRLSDTQVHRINQ